MELTEIEFKILAKANMSNKFKIEYLLNEFPDEKYNTQYRLEELITKKLIDKVYAVQGQSEIGETIQQFTGEYKITGLGKKVLQDCKVEKRIALHRKYEERMWRAIPIIISVMALIISYFALAKSYGWA